MHVYVHWIYYSDSELSNVMCLLFMIVYGVFALALQSISSLLVKSMGHLNRHQATTHLFITNSCVSLPAFEKNECSHLLNPS